MTKRVLFCSYIDFFKPVEKYFSNNTGNAVYYSAGVSYFYSDKLKVDFCSNIEQKLKEDGDFALRNYDIAIIMEANIFAENHIETLKQNAEFVKSLKIPIYVLGAGVQGNIDYETDFADKIESASKMYIDAILNSGGTITLRGDFTKRVLEGFGYNNLFVSGCPSLFYNGRNFSIKNDKVEKSDFKPMLNGSYVKSIDKRIYKKYPNSVFFDQYSYMELLFSENFRISPNDEKYAPPFKELYLNGRIQGNLNHHIWREQIKNGGFNFSYGSKIHGNIIALQSLVPAFVKVIDSRTRELAEFYKIPNSVEIPFNEARDDLYELYKSLDYSDFNSNFVKKFDAFKDFLDSNGIPNCLGDNDKYKDFAKNMNYPSNLSDITVKKEIKDRIPNKYTLKNALNFLFSVKNEYKTGKKRKVVTVLGVKMKFLLSK